jgi:outer membrane protein assembly factor BamB
VGESLASPVVMKGVLFHFDAQEGKETLHALDAHSSKEIWRSVIDDTFKDTQGPAGPRCTPLADDGRVYALSCRGELQCLDAKDGRQLWRTSFTKDFGAVFIGERGSAVGAARHGNNGSPLIYGDHLYACVGATNGAGVVCFDKRTGRVIWKSQNDQAAYAAPVVGTIAGIEQLVCFTVEGVVGLNPKDGQLLWRYPMRTTFGRHATTPVIRDELVVVSSHESGLVGIRILQDNIQLRAERAWLSKEAAMNYASPIAVGKYLYGLGPSKNLVCVEILTGRLMWSKDGYFTTSADKSHASFMVIGENILVLTDGGELLLISADAKEFREVGRAQVCGLNWSSPAYADGKLFVRDGIKTTGNLYCFNLRP